MCWCALYLQTFAPLKAAMPLFVTSGYLNASLAVRTTNADALQDMPLVLTTRRVKGVCLCGLSIFQNPLNFRC